MSSRAHHDVARLRRLKRLAARYGLAVLAAERPNSKAAGGGYMLTDDETRKPLLGNVPAPYSASLDDIEDYIERNTRPEDE
jgi:hypothetical protein